MKKVDTWVVLRLGEGAVDQRDYIAVKGVYDDEGSAQEAVKRTATNDDNKSHYMIVRSRRYYEMNAPEISSKHTPDHIQGFQIKPFTWKMQWNAISTHSHEFKTTRELWNQLPTKVRKRTLIQLISFLVDRAVAAALGATIVENPRSAWDLELPNGARVEVKTVMLDPEHQRAPSFQLRWNPSIQFVAIVLLGPDLAIETAKMIPLDVLEMFSRPISHSTHGSLINVRVTPYLLDHPGSANIYLGQPFLE